MRAIEATAFNKLQVERCHGCEQQRRVEGVPLQEDVVRTLKSVATTTLTTATQRVRGSRDLKMLITFVSEIPSVDG